MQKGILVISIAVVLALNLSGCLGNDSPPTPSIPKAFFTYSAVADAQDTFRFDASGSSGATKYEWNFGGEDTAEGKVVEYFFEFGAGVYQVTLVVSNDRGDKDVVFQEVIVGDGKNAPPTADFVPSVRYIGVDQPFRVDASGTRDPEGDRIRYDWTFNYFMQERDYKIFRERKSKAVYEDTSDEATAAESRSDPIAGLRDTLEGLSSDKESPGHDHGGGGNHGDLAWDGRRESWDDPVFDLLEGFPTPGTYFVKLRVYDVKGASMEYLSEQVWPVQVVEKARSPVFTNKDAPIQDNVTASPPGTIADATDDSTPYYSDRKLHSFENDAPFSVVEVCQEGDLTSCEPQSLFVNITWKDEERIGRDLFVTVTSPAGTKFNPDKAVETADGKKFVLAISGAPSEGTGPWNIEVKGNAGVLIDYEITYWGLLDLTPAEFREIEAPYQD